MEQKTKCCKCGRFVGDGVKIEFYSGRHMGQIHDLCAVHMKLIEKAVEHTYEK